MVDLSLQARGVKRLREGTEEEELWDEMVHLVRRGQRLQGKYARLSLPRSEDKVGQVLEEHNTCGLEMRKLHSKVGELAARRGRKEREDTCSACRYTFSSSQKR